LSPGATEVALSRGGPGHPDELVRVRIAEATTLAHALTGGHGFSPDGGLVNPDLAEAIARSVVRSLENPSLPLTLVGPPLSPRPGTFDYWSEADLAMMASLRSLAVRSQLASSDPSGGRRPVRSVVPNGQPDANGSDEP
jgi:hypothetical protein